MLTAQLNAQDWTAVRIESVKLFYTRKGDKRSKQHIFKHKSEYLKYDKHGNVIEYGEYGLQHCVTPHHTKKEIAKAEKSGESLMTFVRVADFKKVRTVKRSNYNDQNKVVNEEEWELYYDGNKWLDHYSQYFYNDSSLLISKISYRADSTIFEKIGYVYDSSGNLIDEIAFEKRSKEIYNGMESGFLKTRAYNIVHQLILEIDSSNGHKVITQHWHGFNNEFVLCYKDSVEDLIYTENIKKDIYGQPLTVLYRKADGRERTTNYFYDKWSKLKRIEHFSGSKLEWEKTYRYIYKGPKLVYLNPRYPIPIYQSMY